MVSIPMYIVILVSVPEAVFIILLGMHLFNLKEIKILNLLAVACMQGGAAFGVRLLPIPFGIHTVLQLISLCILVRVLLDVDIFRSILSVLLGTVIVTGIQGIIVIPIFNFIGFDIDTNLGTPFFDMIIGVSSFGLAWILLIVIRYKKYILINLDTR